MKVLTLRIDRKDMKSLSTISILLCCTLVSVGQSRPKLRIAQDELKNGNYDKSVELFTELINLPNLDVIYDAYYGRAFSYYKQKKLTLAESDAKVAIKVKPKDAEKRYLKGNSYWLYSLILSQQGSTLTSLKLIKKASKYIQTSSLYSSIGFDQIYLGKYKSAIKSIDKALELDKNNAFAYSNRALAYIKLDRLHAARADITRSIEINNENPWAYKHSALIYIALGEMDQACLELNKAAKIKLSRHMADHKYDEIESLIIKHCNTSE